MASVPIDTATSGDNTLVAAQAGMSIQVTGYVLVAAGAVNVKFKTSSGGELSGAMPMGTNSTVVAPETPAAGPMNQRPFHMETVLGDGLLLNLSGNVQVSGHLTYRYMRH
jgi:hypothetical protein